MRNYFIFDGEDSRDYGLYISGHKTFDSPERNYKFTSVSGKSGDLAQDLGTFKNVELTYQNAFINPADLHEEDEDFNSAFSELKNILLSKSGYCRLEDSYHPDEFRMAVFRKAITPTLSEANDFGVFDLIFDCKPQRFLKSGENPLSYTPSTQGGSISSSITNPTLMDAKPLIRVYGTFESGTVSIGQYSFTIISSTVYTDIDCETMDCYRGANNRNNIVSFTGHKFPKLVPGVNNIIATSGITRIEITPRWFTI